MGKKIKFLLAGLSLCVMAFLISFISSNQIDNRAINGAWKLQNGTVEQVLVFNDGYFMLAIFDKSKKQLIGTRGGAYNYSGKELNTTIEFNTQNKDQVGQKIKYTFDFNIKTNKLSSNIGGKRENWIFVDNGKGPLAGTWRSSGGMRDGKVVLNPPRARKTFKLLTGKRFQWAAINAETKEFFGTGGGSYTYSDGKYTENLDFFTKDSTKVGASLTFDWKVEGDLWHHSGLSSQGARMYEIWKLEPKQ